SRLSSIKSPLKVSLPTRRFEAKLRQRHHLNKQCFHITKPPAKVNFSVNDSALILPVCLILPV
ncbi:MAG: hypothetical protein U9Q05_04420, partial [Thermodesulfobacteriota bacterium]|nr:hypothetical protein [Thermodesulfobacteriota bacterium]